MLGVPLVFARSPCRALLLSDRNTELVMAVGLVVDYMVHIVHFFLHQVMHAVGRFHGRFHTRWRRGWDYQAFLFELLLDVEPRCELAHFQIILILHSTSTSVHPPYFLPINAVRPWLVCEGARARVHTTTVCVVRY